MNLDPVAKETLQNASVEEREAAWAYEDKINAKYRKSIRHNLRKLVGMETYVFNAYFGWCIGSYNKWFP